MARKNVWHWAAVEELLCAQCPVQFAASTSRSRDPAKAEACCFANRASMDRKGVALKTENKLLTASSGRG